MEQEVFSHPLLNERFRELFLSVAKWGKGLAVMGLLFQIVFLCIAVRAFSDYSLNIHDMPHYAASRLRTAIFDSLQVGVFTYIYILFYKCSERFRRCVTEGESELELEKALRTNLRLLKVECAACCIQVVYFSYVLLATK